MKRGILVVALALLLGIGGYSLVSWRRHEALHQLVEEPDYGHHGTDVEHPELDWVKEELEVTEEQFAKIRALHLAYHPVCEELTHKLEASHKKLNRLMGAAEAIGPEIEAALREHAAVHLECDSAMLRHFYETAQCLNPVQARRYLDEMLPLVFLEDSTGAFAPHIH